MRKTEGTPRPEIRADAAMPGPWVWVVRLVLGGALIGAFARTLNLFDHNEHMYVAAGLLVAEGGVPYRDFAYLQTPYLPWLYGGLYAFLKVLSAGPGVYLLAAKLTSFAAFAGSVFLVRSIARALTGETFAALAVTTLFALHPLIQTPTIEASNYALPMLLSLGAFRLFLVPGARRSALFLAGLLAAAAVGFKLTYAPLLLPFGLAAAVFPVFFPATPPAGGAGEDSRSLRLRRGTAAFLAFAAGALAGALPLLLAAAARPEVFLFNNLGFHQLNARWRVMTGYTETLSLPAKLAYAGNLMLRPGSLPLLAALLAGALGSLRRPAGSRPGTLRRALWLGAGLLACAIVATLAPTPTFPQYFALPVSFLFPLLAALGARHGDGRPGWCSGRVPRCLLVACVVAAALCSARPLARSVLALRDRDGWSPLRMTDASRTVRQALLASGRNPNSLKVATLVPIYALESGLAIYPELSTGPFLFRVGDLLTSGQRLRYHGTSPETLGEFLDRDPPAAILVSGEGVLEIPLRRYAEEHGYQGPVRLGDGTEYWIAPP